MDGLIARELEKGMSQYREEPADSELIELSSYPPATSTSGCYVVLRDRLDDGHYSHCFALRWKNRRGREVVHRLDESGCLLWGCQHHATWLPEGWTMDAVPAGWTIQHIESWFRFALYIASLPDRGDLSGKPRNYSPRYAPLPRDLVSHAYLIVRLLNFPDSPREPSSEIDVSGCIAELRNVRAFLQTAPVRGVKSKREIESMSNPVLALRNFVGKVVLYELELFSDITKGAEADPDLVRKQRVEHQEHVVRHSANILKSGLMANCPFAELERRIKLVEEVLVRLQHWQSIPAAPPDKYAAIFGSGDHPPADVHVARIQQLLRILRVPAEVWKFRYSANELSALSHEQADELWDTLRTWDAQREFIRRQSDKLYAAIGDLSMLGRLFERGDDGGLPTAQFDDVSQSNASTLVQNAQNAEIAGTSLTCSEERRKLRRMSCDVANNKAMELAKKDRFFVRRSLREWATAIGCSEGTVARLPFWREVMNKTGRGREDRSARPKAVSFTEKLEAVIGEEDAELNRLIKEQDADYEPSPVDGNESGRTPRKVRKRL